MRKLTSTAIRLREVKAAYERFLTLWALDEMTEQPQLMNRVIRDVQESVAKRAEHLQVSRELADPQNHNWLHLYRGSVLDD
jgi:hypothetical protein